MQQAHFRPLAFLISFLLAFNLTAAHASPPPSATEGIDIERYERLAAQGDPQAQYKLAFYYANESDSLQHQSKIHDLLEKAAAQGDEHAQFNLGLMHHLGEGVPQDHQQALYWYEQAAKQAHVGALTNLGIMYVQGHGVPKNYDLAKSYYQQACELGQQQACVYAQDLQ